MNGVDYNLSTIISDDDVGADSMTEVAHVSVQMSQ